MRIAPPSLLLLALAVAACDDAATTSADPLDGQDAAPADTGAADGDVQEGDATCTPAAEVCNGQDDDCDGLVDEDLSPSACGEGVGECARIGNEICVDGAFVCDAQVGEPIAELCNGLDDDCDGALDEDFDLSVDAQNCGGCGVRCEAPNAVLGCVESECQLTACVEGFVDLDGQADTGCECAVSVEICDGLDNDCDGAVDNLAATEPCTEGVGACAASGMAICVDGALICDATPLAPSAESCNGLDDDCDGVVDNGLDEDGDGQICDQDCDEGDPALYVGAPEICGDGIDQNCNGVDRDCAIPTGHLTSLAIATVNEPRCPDLNGVAGPDNVVGAMRTLANTQIAEMIESGSLALFVAAQGWDEGPGAFDLALLSADLTAAGFVLDRASVDETGAPRVVFTGEAEGDGHFVGGPADFALTLPLGGVQAALTVHDAAMSGVMSDLGDGLTVTGGVAGGALAREEVLALLQAEAPEFAGLLDTLLRPDVDLDGDGTLDAYSICLLFDAAPEALGGYPVQN